MIFYRANLPHLAASGIAERLPYLPASVLEVPPLRYGDTDFARPGIVEQPTQGTGAAELLHAPVDAFVLRDAVVHGRYGVVTLGDSVMEESTAHFPAHLGGGSGWLGHDRLQLPGRPPAAAMAAGYHLLTCNLDNYFHWLLEGIARFDPAELRGVGVLGDAGLGLAPLLPAFGATWQRDSFALLAPPGLRVMALPDGVAVRVARLLYIPEFSGGGWRPHRALLPVFDRMRAAAYAALRGKPAAAGRRLFVSRADSRNRVLENEAELIARAAAAGFEPVVPGTMPVAEQVRLFAEATHIVAPHGAGLTNLAFCRPGTAVCELHMDCYVQWAFRRLAALRGLRYGCLLGPHRPPHRQVLHDNRYAIDPGRLDAVLADPRFIGD